MDNQANKIKVAVIGIRGVDCIYSGFETLARNLAKHFSKKKYFLSFYGRGAYQKNYLGKYYSIFALPTFVHKYLETFLYGFAAHIHSMFHNYDIVLYLGLPSGLLMPFQKLMGRKVIINVDGLDWRRKKWSWLGRAYLLLCKSIAIHWADQIITDSPEIYKYYQNEHANKSLVFIGYGAGVVKRKTKKYITKWGLEKKKYIHTVARITPENNLEDLISAFRKVNTNFRCLIIGDSVYEQTYKKKLLQLAENDARILFTGFIKGKEYEELCTNSLCFVETKSEGGIHPSLLESIAFGNNIIAKDTPTSRFVLKSEGGFYSTNLDLQQKLVRVIKHGPVKQINHVDQEKKYSWKNIITQYETIFERVMQGP